MVKLGKQDFAANIWEYRVNMYRLALSIVQDPTDAEDVVGEAVLKAYEKLDDLRDPGKFRPWIMQIVANEARRIYKQRKRVRCVEDMEPLSPAQEDTYQELWDVVSKLEAIYREVIVLFYYEQLSIKEIGTVLDISQGAVKSRLFRAKRLLKQSLQGGR